MNLNIKNELQYHRYYRVNGKDVSDRTLKLGQSRIITPEEAEAWYQETLND